MLLNYFLAGDVEHLSYLGSIECVSGPIRVIDRDSVYKDVVCIGKVT